MIEARFEATIPGQSLTGEPRQYPWESPPELDKVEDVIKFWFILEADTDKTS